MSEGQGLSIGWASRDITPDRLVNLCGQFHVRISQGIQDPVMATALSISSGDDAFIWVSCDLCYVPDAVLILCRERLKRFAPDFPSEKLIINATHTHTAPEPPNSWYPPSPPGVMTPAEYGEFLIERVAEAAAESWHTRKEGVVAWGYSHAVVAHNRRAVFFDDLSQRPGFTYVPGMKTEVTARMYGDMKDPQFSHQEGYVDHSVNILFTFDETKTLTGAILNVPCPAQESMNQYYISADFWHDVRLELRQRHGDKLFLLPQCAPAGDLTSVCLYSQEAEQRMLKLKGRSPRQEIATRLLDAFDESLRWCKNDLREEVIFKHSTRTIDLPRRFILEQEYRQALADLATFEKPPLLPTADQAPVYHERDDCRFSRRHRCQRVIERYEEQKNIPCLPMELHAIRLGDVAFATNPFELFLDYGLRITGRSPAIQTFLVQLAAGGIPSYLATQRAVEGGSYSACLYCNEIGPDGGQVLVEKTLALLHSLWSEAV